jgi:hypothetical protein
MSVTSPDAAATSSSATSGRANRGRAGGGSRPHGSRGGAGRQRNNENGGQQTATNRSRAMFRGLTDDMGGNVFQCYEEQDDRRQYAKTIEALDAYAKNKNLSYTADLSPIFAATMTEPKIERPVTIEEGADKLDEMIFAEEVKEYFKRTQSLKSNLATIYAVAWGQCSGVTT